MEQNKKSLSPSTIRALSAFAVFAVAGMVVFDWVFDSDGATTWLGAIFGGFAGVIFFLLATLLILGVVLKIFDWMR